MLETLLGIEEAQNVADIDVRVRGPWILAIALLAGAGLFSYYLYRADERLSKGRRMFLGLCQVLALAVLIIIVLEPVADVRIVKPLRRSLLVLLDTSRSMKIEDHRTNKEDVERAAKVLGQLGPAESLSDDKLESVRHDVGPVSRAELARVALTAKEGALLTRLEEQFDLRVFSFDSELRPEGGAAKPIEWIGKQPSEGDSSHVGSAIDEAVARYAGQPLHGVVVLSDFSWVGGEDPVRVAKTLGQREVPVYAVPVGLPDPPDIRVRRVIAPDVVFQGDRVPVRVQVDSSGFDGKRVELSMAIDGERSSSASLELQDGAQFAELTFTPQQESGTLELNFTIEAQAGETAIANNRRSHKVRILDEKIRVLYVEGMPRWEFRYLRWVLLRDPRLDVTFLMTQGDPTLAKTSPRHISRFPENAEDVLKFDLIILGDVPSKYFSGTQLDLMEQLVRKGGGSLLMLAGPMAAPTTYRETPIEKVLPVRLGSGPWRGVSSQSYPIVTPEGEESDVTSLSLSKERSARVWSHVRPIHSVPQLHGAKPAATVLLTLPQKADESSAYPLVAWHRYGTGKSLFVATEDLWRMRREVGDLYHARFWGQTIQFLTLSRLLGQNKQISLETTRRKYSTGDSIQLYANVLTESFEPVLQPSYVVVLEKEGDADSVTEIELSPVPNSPGLYTAPQLAGADGTYILKTLAKDAEISNEIEFEVATVPLEERETAARRDVAAAVAELSGGKLVELSALGGLDEVLGAPEDLERIVKIEKDLWDTPLLFIVLTLLAGMEWYFRRRDNLV